MIHLPTLRTALIVILLLLTAIPHVVGVSSDDAMSHLDRVFSEVRAAEYAGGDVSNLTPKLNEVLRLLDSGSALDVAAADTLLTQIEEEARGIRLGGEAATNNQYITVGVTLVGLCGVIVITWRYGSRIVWAAWARTKKGWVVKAT